ncbi:hypothetical protein [Lutibacter citreus]|uniref:hypothetical protein n=1 Tax=Lutibacter citreus TaxID=2138210 RepID=UPI000DBE70FF|nr:hypothetical protein [Lutibacter citreus]
MQILKKIALFFIAFIAFVIIGGFALYNYLKLSHIGSQKLAELKNKFRNNIITVLAGQFGNLFCNYNSYNAKIYNKGEFRKIRLNKQEVRINSTNLTIIPKNG